MTEMCPVTVRIFGVPSAPGCAAERTWEAVTEWIGAVLGARFGPRVRTEYIDLFGPAMGGFPEIVALVAAGTTSPPIVLVDEFVVSTGGKVSIPAIARVLEARGLRSGESALGTAG